MRRIWISLVCASLLGLVACSDDSSSSSNDGGTASSTPAIKQTINAAKGGTIKAKGATLDFPAGALDSDLEITVATVDKASLPSPKTVASTVFDFGPNGTKFKKPVGLTLAFAGSAPKGSTAKVAWLDGTKWTALDDSKVDGTSATATTMHFTKFAVVFIIDGTGAGTQTGGMCEGMDTSCGGDVVGTWEFSAGCATVDPATLFGKGDSSNPLASCKGIGVAISVDLSGTITFNKDLTYAQHSMTDFGLKVSIPKSCLGGNCDALNGGSKDSGETVTDDGTNCNQESAPKPSANDETGTYVKMGTNMLQTTSDNPDAGAGDAGAGDPPSEYCVKGNVLTAKNISSDGTIVYYTATKTK